MSMSKKKNEVAVVEEKSSAVAVVNSSLPSYLAGFTGPTGTEDIGAEDVTIPRLKIGQDMNKEVQSGDVERGDLFLNVTGATLVEAGSKLPFVVLARAKEYILWRPKKDNGGGILARAKPVNTPDGVRYAWDKPNTTFDVKVEGHRAGQVAHQDLHRRGWPWTSGVQRNPRPEGQQDRRDGSPQLRR
jgi:hypothetical protein